MNYNELIETISLIVENEKIYKEGMTITYTLDEKNHIAMNTDLFYKINPTSTVRPKDIIPVDMFEVELGGILVKFVKPTNEDSEE